MKAKKRQSQQPRQTGKVDLPRAEPSTPTLLPAATSWIRYLARIQDETFYFLHACSSRSVETMKRLSTCRKIDDVVDAHASLAGDLLSDFAEEGALMASFFYEPAAQPAATEGTKRAS